MGNITDKVAIVGMGCCKFGDLWSQSFDDLIVDAAYEAYQDAGIDPKEIQAAWMGTVMTANVAINLARPLKLFGIPCTRVENGCASGTEAFRNACFAIASGMYDICLAVGFEKRKDIAARALSEPSYDPAISYGRSAPGEYALLATGYFNKYGLTVEEGKRSLAQIAVKNHHNGTMSPKAHFRAPVTLEQAINAPLIASPLGLFDCCPTTDGAAAALLMRADLAKSIRDDYVLVKALSVAAGDGMGVVRQGYDFSHIRENERAGQEAYRQAGITDPFKQLSLAQVHDCFTIHELTIYEDLGFCPRGKAPEYIEAGAFNLEGGLPVNTDGGLKSFGHPLGATGLRMIYETYKQLQGKAGQRQVPNAALGLTHNMGGGPGFGGVATVTILGR